MSVSHSIIAFYFFVLLLLLVYCLHRYWIVFLYFRNRKKALKPPPLPENLPLVTVQLPVYNEVYVVERLIHAAASIDYPPDRLEIQVLDDSNDETSQAAAEAAGAARRQGLSVQHIRRESRAGFKAGALAEGLKTARGELVAVFDADFVPPKDFLLKTVPFFSDSSIGMVQCRWDHLNRDHSGLTQVQAMLLDAHFILEHTARHRSGRFFNFNGTAGIWRRQCIDSAGGWQHDTLTEDLDLSYRAQLQGWKFLFLPEVTAPAEIPVDVCSFKSQQHRWAKGGMETALKILPRLLKSSIPLRTKVEAVFHLTCNANYLLVLLLAAMAYPALVVRIVNGWRSLFLFDVILFWGATLPICLYYLVSQRQAGQPWMKRILYLPFLMAIGIGLSINNGKAVAEALLGFKSDFFRTPKFKIESRSDPWKTKKYRNAFARFGTAAEFFMGLYFLSAIGFACAFKVYDAIPFLALFCAGFFYISLLSLMQGRAGLVEKAVLLLVLLAGTAAQAEETRPASAKLLPPAAGLLYHGVHAGLSLSCGSAFSADELAAYETAAGKRAAIIGMDQNWFQGQTFPRAAASWITARGSVPYIRLMLWSGPQQYRNETAYSIENILAGRLDDAFRRWARDARDFAKPLLVEFGTEVNGNWYPWSGCRHGAGEQKAYGDPSAPDGPERFRDAYRRIITLMRGEGAGNITWVFHVNYCDWPDEPWNRLEHYYPGGDYIDWLGISVYGQQRPGTGGSPEFREIMDSVYPRLIKMCSDKPVFIAEFGTVQGSGADSQGRWAQKALADLAGGRWPRVAGFSWWNRAWQNDRNPAHDSSMRIQDNPALAAVFRELVGNNPCVLKGIIQP